VHASEQGELGICKEKPGIRLALERGNEYVLVLNNEPFLILTA
jgi:hypothetical protein